MFVILTYLLGYLALGSLIFILRPELVDNFSAHFPNLTSQDIPLSLLIFNYTFLAVGLALINEKEDKKDNALLAGGVIASSSVAVMYNLSFIFNLLWRAIDQKYFVVIMIILYAINLGIPLFVYGLKRNQSNEKSSSLVNNQIPSILRKIIAEIKLELLQKKLGINEIQMLESKLENPNLNNTKIIEAIDDLIKMGISSDIPPNQIQKLLNVKTSITSRD
ncbi:hypothetical protein M2124_001220 [Polynucleobacter sphagniphilus]|uniref:hypothetical protein n=1 Tax=Polynucleobacter sphagniphilus TaxID=1743169 RepID=UPI002473F991|nr:hypothetical protein [Polynucleobacter sphagniphilus]MDH6154948.1 hypothetical protein [Polynucleobacter sphagniphilus]